MALPGSRAHAVTIARSLPSLIVDALPSEHETVQLTPGSALYIPPYAIHWVRSVDRSVSLSCSWSTPATSRAGAVHAANARLLRLHLPVRPVGSRGEEVKLAAVAAARRLRRAARR